MKKYDGQYQAKLEKEEIGREYRKREEHRFNNRVILIVISLSISFTGLILSAIYLKDTLRIIAIVVLALFLTVEIIGSFLIIKRQKEILSYSNEELYYHLKKLSEKKR